MRNKTIIYETNLDRFRFHDVNREIDDTISKREIREMAEDMKVNGFRFTEPIVVTKNFWIIDGQHRVEAAKAAGVGIYYVIDESVANSPKAIFEAFLIYNRHKKVVRKNDFVHGYSAMGNENFQILQQFGEKYPMFSMTERMLLLRNSGTKNPSKESFQNGKFEIGDVKKAEKWANYLLELKPLFEKGYNKSNFVRAMLTILEKKKQFKFDEFLHKVKLRPSSIYLCGDRRSYCEMIEDIYNFKRRESEKLNLRF